MNPFKTGLLARRHVGQLDRSSQVGRQPAGASSALSETAIPTAPAPQPSGVTPPSATPPRPFPWLWRDPALLGASVLVGLVIGYQLTVTLLRPAWSGPVTDWLRAALAWPELLMIVSVSLWLSRPHRRNAASWWMWSIAFLSYA